MLTNCFENDKYFFLLCCVGLTTDDALFDSCDPFFPQITGVSEGRNLRIRYKTGSFIQYRGFLMRYLQQGCWNMQFFIYILQIFKFSKSNHYLECTLLSENVITKTLKIRVLSSVLLPRTSSFKKFSAVIQKDPTFSWKFH